MPIIQLATPLEWPSTMQVTDRLARSNGNGFPQDLQDHDAFAFLQDEIDRTPLIFSAVLFSNAINVNSPMPTQFLSKNPGVTLRVTIDNEQYCISCDRWLKLAHNIYALHLALRHFRQLIDWGIGDIHAVLAGYSTKAAHHGHGTAGVATSDGGGWREFLGLGSTATLDDANAVYRHRAKAIGESDPSALQQLNLAIQEARKYLQ